ncbi:MarR family winged helix-turn-helix transcriptional regulator [Pseudochelatococcus sp. B33]
MTKGNQLEDAQNAKAAVQVPRLPEHVKFSPDSSLPHLVSVLANRASLVLYSMYSSRFGLSVMGWRIIAILGNHAPLSATTITEMIASDPVTVSRATAQLSKKRLIQRRIDKSDRRRQLLRLSDHGMEVYQQVLPLMYAVERAMLSGLDEEDRGHLMRIISRISGQTATLLGPDSDWERLLEDFGYSDNG